MILIPHFLIEGIEVINSENANNLFSQIGVDRTFVTFNEFIIWVNKNWTKTQLYKNFCLKYAN
jgi:hypothetical protein